MATKEFKVGDKVIVTKHWRLAGVGGTVQEVCGICPNSYIVYCETLEGRVHFTVDQIESIKQGVEIIDE